MELCESYFRIFIRSWRGECWNRKRTSNQSAKGKKKILYFLQANLTGENTKHGFERKELIEI
ncbi:hypothetical protein C5473_21650 [Leptospira interrogans serovar Weerasinghe]|nr:hypothetical protein C5473_21650 [Leptospira interrogans serovar Weerasinghe]